VANESIYKLLEARTLSVRSFNVCQANNLLDLDSLLDYYLTHFDFRQLRGIGLKSNQELTDRCEQYMEAKNNEPDSLGTKAPEVAVTPQDAPLRLSSTQRQHLDHITLHHFQSLSRQARNYLNSHLDNQVNIDAVYRYFKIVQNSPNFWIANTSDKVGLEIAQFAAKLIQLYDDIATHGDFKIKQLQFESWLKYTFSLGKLAPSAIEKSYYEGPLKLFMLIDALINRIKFFSKIGTFIFQNRFGYYEGVPVKQLEDISHDFGLSRERVRQIASKVPENFVEKLVMLAKLPGSFDHLADYGWELGNDLFFVTPESAQAVSQAENVQFSQRFYTLFLWAQAKGSYQVFPLEINGEEYDFLVKSDLYEAFNFPAFLRDTGRLLRRKVRKIYFMNFEEYLRTYLKNEKDHLLLPRLKQLCRELLLAQYKGAVPFDADGNLSFENHLKGPILQAMVFQLLDSENRPMHANEIYDRLKDHPDYPIKGKIIGQYILDDKDSFIFFGRTSTYGLRKWEAQQKDMKGGTIRNIVEEYLAQWDSPKHISEITAYVQRYRPTTNEQNVIGNFKLAKNGKIQSFSNGFWGLFTKNYDPEWKQYKAPPPHIHNYILRYLAKNGEVPIEQLMSHFTQTYELAEIQVDAKLETMLQNGLLQISDEGMVRSSKAKA